MHRILMAALLLTATPALAQDLKSMTLANELGSVLAAEQFCDLSYDQGAIAAYVTDHVAADDMSFPSMLGTMVQGHEYGHATMSASGKTAHCTQVARLAANYGFTR